MKIVKRLIQLADSLDRCGLKAEANSVDMLIRKAVGDGKNPQPGVKMDPKTRAEITKILLEMSTGNNHKYYESSAEALNLIDAAIKPLGVIALNDEDNTPFQGSLNGKSSNTNIKLGLADASKGKNDMHTPISDAMIAISWHLMQHGKYEVLAYLS